MKDKGHCGKTPQQNVDEALEWNLAANQANSEPKETVFLNGVEVPKDFIDPFDFKMEEPIQKLPCEKVYDRVENEIRQYKIGDGGLTDIYSLLEKIKHHVTVYNPEDYDLGQAQQQPVSKSEERINSLELATRLANELFIDELHGSEEHEHYLQRFITIIDNHIK